MLCGYYFRMPPITYRPATIDDVEPLSRLRAAFLAEVRDADANDPVLLSSLRSWFAEKLPTRHFQAILAIADGQVIACSGLVVHEHPPGIMTTNGREAYIMNMYTLPAWRGRGIATTIFNQLLELARKENCSRAALHALPIGRPIYEKAGFKACDMEMRMHL
jgi:GNAT superfamily N-acetyltransferase